MKVATAVQDDEILGSYYYRVIRDNEKPFVRFNDGNLAFTIQFTSLEEREKGNGVLYTAAMFRTMTDLSEEEFRATYPVVFDTFWHAESKGALNVTEMILRQDWDAKLCGDVIYNNGDRLVKAMLLDDGNEGLDHLYRTDTSLSRDEFLQEYPVTLDMQWPEDVADEFFSEVDRMEVTWEEGRQRVIEIAKEQGFLVETKCPGENCDSIGFALEDESNVEVVSKALDNLHDALHAAGFHRNAAIANRCARNGNLFTPVAEAESYEVADPA